MSHDMQQMRDTQDGSIPDGGTGADTPHAATPVIRHTTLSEMVREKLLPFNTIASISGLVGYLLGLIAPKAILGFAAVLAFLLLVLCSLDVFARVRLVKWSRRRRHGIAILVGLLWHDEQRAAYRTAPFIAAALACVGLLIYYPKALRDFEASQPLPVPRSVLSLSPVALPGPERDPTDAEWRNAILAEFAKSKRITPECNLRSYLRVDAYKVEHPHADTLRIYTDAVATFRFTKGWQDIARENRECAKYDDEYHELVASAGPNPITPPEHYVVRGFGMGLPRLPRKDDVYECRTGACAWNQVGPTEFKMSLSLAWEDGHWLSR